jgi:hypothetical protein
MHNEGTGPILSCAHTAHTDEQLITCLATEWNVTVPQLVALLAGLVFAHAERGATRDTAQVGHLTLLPDLPGRTCEWCHRPLPAGIHHSRKYCPDTDCKREAYNAWQRQGRPSRKNAP